MVGTSFREFLWNFVCLVTESVASKMEYIKLLKRGHVSFLHFAVCVFSEFPHSAYVVGVITVFID
jgi:hypothetical protein